MSRNSRMRRIILGSRWLLAALFLYAGFIKAGAGERFTVTIAKFNILPESWVIPFRFGLPAVEILAAILLLIPRTGRIGASAIAGLLAMFLAALGYAWSQHYTIDCGCFGETQPANFPLAITRDPALLALTLLVAARRVPPSRPEAS